MLNRRRGVSFSPAPTATRLEGGDVCSSITIASRARLGFRPSRALSYELADWCPFEGPDEPRLSFSVRR